MFLVVQHSAHNWQDNTDALLFQCWHKLLLPWATSGDFFFKEWTSKCKLSALHAEIWVNSHRLSCQTLSSVGVIGGAANKRSAYVLLRFISWSRLPLSGDEGSLFVFLRCSGCASGRPSWSRLSCACGLSCCRLITARYHNMAISTSASLTALLSDSLKLCASVPCLLTSA